MVQQHTTNVSRQNYDDDLSYGKSFYNSEGKPPLRLKDIPKVIILAVLFGLIFRVLYLKAPFLLFLLMIGAVILRLLVAMVYKR